MGGKWQVKCGAKLSVERSSDHSVKIKCVAKMPAEKKASDADGGIITLAINLTQENVRNWH